MKAYTCCIAIAVLAAAGSTEQTAKADIIAQASVASSFDQSFPGCSDRNTTVDTPTTADCSGLGFTADAFAEAGFGTMKVSADATRTTFDLAGFQTGAFVDVRDDFTVLNASKGDTFVMEFSLDGDFVMPESGDCGGAACSSDANLQINAGLSGPGGTGCLVNIQQSYSKSDPFVCTMDRPLSAATTNFFSVIELTASVELRSLTTGTVDYSNTLDVDKVVVLLPDGEIDPNAIIETNSGFTYPTGAPPSAVPEPSSLLISVSGLCVIVAIKRRKSRSGNVEI